MAQAAQVIQALGGEAGNPVVNESLSAAASAIKPGHLIEELSAGTVQEQSTAKGNAQRLIALTNISNGNDITTAYAVGETVRYGAFHPGQEVFARLAANAAAIVKGNALVAAGDGTLRLATSADVKATLAIAGEADTDGALTFTSKLDGDHGNDIQIILADADVGVGGAVLAFLTIAGQADSDGAVTYTSKLDGDHGNDIQIIQNNAGTGAVTVDGLVITVTPDTGANTATDVVAQIVADPGASSLVTAVAGGTGATEPGIGTIANLAGGLDIVDGVVVDGLVITITPDTAANTATDVVAQIVADAGASSLISAVAGGSGATEPGNATIANMTGGLDGEIDSDQTLMAFAKEAIDNSAGATEVFIKVRIA